MNSDEEQCSIDEDEENSEVGEQTVEQEVVIGSPEKRPRIVQNVGIPAIWNFLRARRARLSRLWSEQM